MATSFDALFAPRSVALVGASDRPNSVGNVTLKNLRSGFSGALYLVNPAHDAVGGARAYRDVMQLPQTPDLAIVATPPAQVSGVVAQLAQRGTAAAVVITAGFGELGERGAQMQREMVAAAKSMRIVGPNCVGVISPAAALNASFAHIAPEPGGIAFFSQSGALVTAVLDWAVPRGIGFSRVVSLGDMADLDFTDMLAFAAGDPATHSILLYVESIVDGRRFVEAARAAAAGKPVIVLKAGRSSVGAHAAHSHTGALSGSDRAYEAAFRRAGLLRVDTMPEMFDAVETLQFAKPQEGGRIAIVTNGGGLGVLSVDALAARGGTLATLAPETIAALDRVLPATWSRGNPVDIIGDAGPERYANALRLLLADGANDAVLVLNCPVALADSSEVARAVIETIRKEAPARNVFAAWVGEHAARPARDLFRQARLPCYETPDDAADAIVHCVAYHQAAQTASEPQPPPAPRNAHYVTLETILSAASQRGARWLEPADVDAFMNAYGIPIVQTRYPADADAVAEAARELGGAVAVKVRSPEVTHKSDAGGVALNVRGADAAREAARTIQERIRAAFPAARIEGFTVQPMIERPGAIELIAGINVDRTFGPMVLFGRGGTAVEIIDDTSLELAPLDERLARAQIARTRVARVLAGYRNQPGVDVDAVARVLVALGALALAHPSVRELDINPLLADQRGVIALDVRIGLPESFSPQADNSGNERLGAAAHGI